MAKHGGDAVKTNGVAMTPERRAAIWARLDALCGPGPKRPKLKLVCVGGRIVADARVIVSPDDPNWYKGPRAVLTNGVVTVRGDVVRRW